MAWQARLSGPVIPNGREVSVGVEYYDDADPTTVLHIKSFSFPVGWSSQDMGDAIRAEGIAVRASTARAAALTVQFPAATTVIQIP